MMEDWTHKVDKCITEEWRNTNREVGKRKGKTGKKGQIK